MAGDRAEQLDTFAAQQDGIARIANPDVLHKPLGDHVKGKQRGQRPGKLPIFEDGHVQGNPLKTLH